MNRYTMTLHGKVTVVSKIEDVMSFCKNNGHKIGYADLYKPNVDDYEIGNIRINIERNV